MPVIQIIAGQSASLLTDKIKAETDTNCRREKRDKNANEKETTGEVQ